MEPIALDLRTLTGQQIRGSQPVMVECPWHNDTDASLMVDVDHGWCFRCEKYVRRYAMAALLLGVWDGKTHANGRVYEDASIAELDAVRIVKAKFEIGAIIVPSSTVLGGKHRVVQQYTDEEVESAARTFHRYLMSDRATDASGVSMLEFLKGWRHFNERTIRNYRIGWTGSHFTVPVPSLSGTAWSIRYRSHPVYRGVSRYEGLVGRNAPCLFSMPHVARGSGRELWAVEGEFDYLSTVQLGGWAATVTNGARSIVGLPEQIAHLNIVVERWVIATDQDEAGEQAAWEIARQVQNPYRAYWSVGKDMNAYMKAGGDLGSTIIVPYQSRSYFLPLDKPQIYM